MPPRSDSLPWCVLCTLCGELLHDCTLPCVLASQGFSVLTLARSVLGAVRDAVPVPPNQLGGYLAPSPFFVFCLTLPHLLPLFPAAWSSELDPRSPGASLTPGDRLTESLAFVNRIGQALAAIAAHVARSGSMSAGGPTSEGGPREGKHLQGARTRALAAPALSPFSPIIPGSPLDTPAASNVMEEGDEDWTLPGEVGFCGTEGALRCIQRRRVVGVCLFDGYFGL